ncbi:MULTISPECIES: hypothetical protein [Lysinibacillus]|uniref:hypothetical protein n=1 Tax=Lysinibacillus TaxID=400634 RepID=UPI00214C2E5A|nr:MULTISPECIES: hypothetical protein [Lysinibacillus]UNT53558.1 hypothetical protein ICJ70_13465 [Lysinibacillus capsici]UUV26719.1 hypothetical protein NP781_09080 [Lysinibacillus sp. FN11]UYB49601.1 hypothetical protein OCI51_11770 [Lysinibacillus capsici]
MKKILFILLLSVLVVGAIFMIYLKSNPPLVIQSYTSKQGNEAIKIIALENTGLREIKLKQILVNDQPSDSAKLVISKSEPFEAETKLEGNDQLSFHKLAQRTIVPQRYINQQAIGEQPQHYAVQVQASNNQKVTIHYEYLKIPFTLTVELQANK